MQSCPTLLAPSDGFAKRVAIHALAATAFRDCPSSAIRMPVRFAALRCALLSKRSYGASAWRAILETRHSLRQCLPDIDAKLRMTRAATARARKLQTAGTFVRTGESELHARRRGTSRRIPVRACGLAPNLLPNSALSPETLDHLYKGAMMNRFMMTAAAAAVLAAVTGCQQKSETTVPVPVPATPPTSSSSSS